MTKTNPCSQRHSHFPIWLRKCSVSNLMLSSKGVFRNTLVRGFSSGPVANISSLLMGSLGSILVQGTRSRAAAKSSHVATKVPHATLKIEDLRVPTKTWCSQINAKKKNFGLPRPLSLHSSQLPAGKARSSFRVSIFNF